MAARILHTYLPTYLYLLTALRKSQKALVLMIDRPVLSDRYKRKKKKKLAQSTLRKRCNSAYRASLFAHYRSPRYQKKKKIQQRTHNTLYHSLTHSLVSTGFRKPLYHAPPPPPHNPKHPTLLRTRTCCSNKFPRPQRHTEVASNPRTVIIRQQSKPALLRLP